MTHEVDGRTYLWCPYGDRAQWYRNLLADPVVTVQSGRSMQGMCAVGVEDVDEAVEVISALRRFDATYLHSYLAAVGVADTSEDIARNLERLHLRRLEPSREDGPPGLRVDLAWVWSVLAAAAVVRSVMVGRRRARMRAR